MKRQNPLWYHYLVLFVVLLVVGYLLQSCGALVSPKATDAASSSETVRAINDYRASLGLARLTEVAELAAAADFHNAWMRDNGCWSHQCPGEPSPTERARNAGYVGPVAEIIGRGYLSPAAVVMGWRNSPGHNAILTGRYLDIGCARLDGDGGPWWTCDLGNRGGGVAVPTPLYTPRPIRTPDPTGIPPTRSPSPTTPPTATPTPTRGPLPPAGYRMVVVMEPAAGWYAWDYAYWVLCSRPGVRCSWPRTE